MAFSSNDPRNYAAIGKQSAAGTEATVFNFPKFLNDTVVKAEEETESIFEGGDGQVQGLHFKKWVKADGELEVFARPLTFAYLSAFAMGSAVAVPSTAAADIASHCYVPNATLPALTIEHAFAGGNEIERVSDAVISGITIEGEAGMPWKVNVPFIGGGTYYYRDGSASALTASLEGALPGIYQNGAVLIDGATSLDVRKFTVQFERKIDDNLYTNQMFRRTVVPLTQECTVTAQVIFQSNALWKKIKYGTGSMPSLNLATGAFSARAGNLASSQLLGVDVPCLNYTNVALNRLNPDGETVVMDVTGKAVKSATGILQLRANIIGRATSYLTNDA